MDRSGTLAQPAEWILRAADERCDLLAFPEALVVVDIDPARVREERHNSDPVDHYVRPDVLRLTVNRERLRRAWDDAGGSALPCR